MQLLGILNIKRTSWFCEAEQVNSQNHFQTEEIKTLSSASFIQ